MNTALGLRILSEIMDWSLDEAREEFRWLAFMSTYKYDGYRDYLAGVRFIESLATWLQQFSETEERKTAYQFVKKRLIYFSPAEIQRLVEKFFPEVVQDHLVEYVSANLLIPSYRIWSTQKSIDDYRWERRKTLFMGLSDGARIDTLRRMNVGAISNEQIVIATQIDPYKWESLVDDLQQDLSKMRAVDASEEYFSRVYLIDDFTASGTSLLPDPDNTEGKLKGKLVKFATSLKNAEGELKGKRIFSEGFEIVVHHYIATETAVKNIKRVYKKVAVELATMGLANINFSYGMTLLDSLSVKDDPKDPFSVLCKKYYDARIEGKSGKHGRQSGSKDKTFGYANCGTTIVLEHNTPNNSVPLLWSETRDQEGELVMRPLFRRRERHSDMEQNYSRRNRGNDGESV